MAVIGRVGGALDAGVAGEPGVIATLRAHAPWFVGICFCNVWIGWMNGAHALAPVQLWDVLCAGVMSLTLLAGVWWGWRHPSSGASGPMAADWPIAALMALATLPAAGFVLGGSAPVLACATALSEVGMAWLYVRWGAFLARLSLRATVGCIFGAHVVGCSVKLALYYVPASVSALPVALLPLASVAFLHRALAGAPERHEPEAVWCSGRGTWGPLWKIAAFVACYRVLFQASSLVGAPGGSLLSLSTICCLAEIAVSLVIIYMLLVRSGSFTFQQVWSIFLLLMGVVLLLSLLPELMAWGTAIRAAIGSLLVMFSWLVFADVAHHSTLSPLVIFGVARLAYELPRLAVQGAALAGGLPELAGEGRLALVGALFFCLLVFAVWFFDWRDPTLALVFSDFQKRASEPAQDAVREACEAAASDFGLTAREAEVLLYLCQGRTRAYIAETLYLSENTVRGHTQRIYGKLGVHNKTELQRKLGV